MSLILPRWDLQTLFFGPDTPLSGICTYTKHPQPHPKTPFSWLELDSGQNELPFGQDETPAAQYA